MHGVNHKILEPTAVYWWQGKPNFGDMLNHPMLDYMRCEHLEPEQIRQLRPDQAEGIAIGSVLDMLLKGKNINPEFNNRPVKVWGSGFLRPPISNDEAFVKELQIYALRGQKSKERCEKILGYSLNNVPLGDPGLLVKRIYPHVKPEPNCDVGIIYHHRDAKSQPCLEKIAFRRKSFRILDISVNPDIFVEQVSRCRVILSSAMHPLICADSMGIPNCHIIVSDNKDVLSYKFEDYYSVFHNYNYCPIDLRTPLATIGDDTIDLLSANYQYRLSEIENICNRLEEVFPFPRKGSLMIEKSDLLSGGICS